MASARSICRRPVDEPACDVVRRPDGQPEVMLAPHWSGLPLGLFTIPGCEERGASDTPYPTLLVAQHGQGERWYRSALHTRHLHTAPGMVALYPAGLEFERMRWQSAPDRVVLKSANASVSMPICPFPKKATYKGSGAITSEASYVCS